MCSVLHGGAHTNNSVGGGGGVVYVYAHLCMPVCISVCVSVCTHVSVCVSVHVLWSCDHFTHADGGPERLCT